MNSARRSVWISGASSGIGKAVAQACQQRGDRLILSARRREVLDTVRQEIGALDALVLNVRLDALVHLVLDVLAVALLYEARR